MNLSLQKKYMKRKTKENLTVQKQITYSGDVLHFEQQWKCKMTIQAKNIRHIEREKNQNGLSHGQSQT